jgi:hypothetical protein
MKIFLIPESQPAATGGIEWLTRRAAVTATHQDFKALSGVFRCLACHKQSEGAQDFNIMLSLFETSSPAPRGRALR